MQPAGSAGLERHCPTRSHFSFGTMALRRSRKIQPDASAAVVRLFALCSPCPFCCCFGACFGAVLCPSPFCFFLFPPLPVLPLPSLSLSLSLFLPFLLSLRAVRRVELSEVSSPPYPGFRPEIGGLGLLWPLLACCPPNPGFRPEIGGLGLLRPFLALKSPKPRFSARDWGFGPVEAVFSLEVTQTQVFGPSLGVWAC